MQQMQYLLSGMFGRACKLIGDGAGTAELAREVRAHHRSRHTRSLSVC